MLRKSVELCVWLGCLLFCQSAFASRIMVAEIKLFEARVVLTSDASDDGKASHDAVWAKLKDLPFGNECGGVSIRPDPDNPLLSTLEGKIEVSITDCGAAKVDRLRLIRTKKSDFVWKIHPDDVVEMGKKRK